jgi:glycolate oxidase
MSSWLPALRRLGVPTSTEPAVLAEHGTDAWMAAVTPEAVTFPRTAAEVSQVLRFAHRRGIPVTARGAGKGYVGGCVPQHKGIVVSLMRMNRIREIHSGDFVAVVEPGVITSKLQAAVEKKGLFYPPDPASRDTCSLGGNVATNAGGPRCLKYGVTRNYVLGLEVALADGTLVRCGGRTHKNKTGFDLVGLFTGSEGVLGIATELTLKLLPLPPARVTVSATFARADQAAAAVRAVLGAGFLPCSLEVADAFTLESARRHLGSKVVPAGNAHLLVELDGQAESVRSELKSVAALIRKVGALSLRTADTPEASEELWSLRRNFSPALKVHGLTKLNEDIVVPRGKLVDLFRFAGRMQKEYGVPVACFGHAGDGNIHVNLMCDLTRKGERARMDRALDLLFRQVLAWGGAITGEHGIGLAKKRWWNDAVPPATRDLHTTIKHALDPKGILNPGKFV